MFGSFQNPSTPASNGFPDVARVPVRPVGSGTPSQEHDARGLGFGDGFAAPQPPQPAPTTTIFFFFFFFFFASFRVVFCDIVVGRQGVVVLIRGGDSRGEDDASFARKAPRGEMRVESTNAAATAALGTI